MEYFIIHIFSKVLSGLLSESLGSNNGSTNGYRFDEFRSLYRIQWFFTRRHILRQDFLAVGATPATDGIPSGIIRHQTKTTCCSVWNSQYVARNDISNLFLSPKYRGSWVHSWPRVVSPYTHGHQCTEDPWRCENVNPQALGAWYIVYTIICFTVRPLGQAQQKLNISCIVVNHL